MIKQYPKIFCKKIRVKLKEMFYRPKAYIFIIHRVEEINKEGIKINEILKISPKSLEEFIILCRKKKYNFISIERFIKMFKKKELTGKEIILTIDDGYKDVFERGLSILEKYKIPFVFYLSTSFLERRFFYWWYLLEEIILKNEEVIFKNKKYKCKSLKEKNALFKKIRRKIAFLKDEEELKDLFSNYELKVKKDYYNSLFLQWKEIREKLKNPLITIGNHGDGHFFFNSKEEEEIEKDIIKAQNLIKKNLNIKTKHFSYPYGDIISISKKHSEIIKRLGFVSGVTTENRPVNYKDDLLYLPRINLSEFNYKKIIRKLK
ncbi:MAG: polysaccharide deacetylase family protein [Candidatus Pacearchaeota archaeon]